MRGRDRCPSLPQHVKFVAGEGTARVQRDFALPIRRSGQGRCRAGNRTIGDAKPNHLSPNLRPTSRGGRSPNLTGKPPSPPQRGSRSPRDDLIDPVSRFA